MKSRIATTLLFGLALAFSATVAWAQVVICTEDFFAGCVTAVNPAFPDSPIAASDGEFAFDPFGAGFDTSDGIRFSDLLPPPVFIGSPGWVQIDPFTWVLPADLSSIGCGVENEPSCEPVGAWTYLGETFNPFFVGTYLMLSSDGVTISDVIVASNNGPHGTSLLTFSSDPIPEPTTLALLGIGLAGLALRRRR